MNKGKLFTLLIIVLAFSMAMSGCQISGKPKPRASSTQGGQQQQGQGSSSNQGANTETPGGDITTPVKEQLAKQSQIKKFKSLDELQEFLENNSTDSGSYGYMGRGEIMEEMAFSDSLGVAAPMAKTQALDMPTDAGGGSDDFSKTNVQVEGVDEADIIKTDGKNIYAVAKNNLFIINAYPAENAEILSKIEFKSRPQDVYINDNYLIIYGNDQEIYRAEPYQRFRRHNPFTFVKIFDVSDPKNPKQVRDLDFEGSYSNSRLIGDYLYFVTSNYNYYYIDEEPVLPRILEDGEEISIGCIEGQVGCLIPDIYYFDIPYSSYNFTTVTAVNVKNKEEAMNSEVYLMSGSQNMYVSLENLYITYTKYISEYQLEMEVMREIVYPRLSAKDQDKIAKIEAVDNFILSTDEKLRKITEILERWTASLTDEEQSKLEDELAEKMKAKYTDISKELEKTVIHKVGIDKNNIEYKATGEVTGQVLNQFSMDESGGYFRIATTKNRTWSRYEEEQKQSYNNMYVLDENLKVVGSLEGLAEDERIYSVRFMQGRAYMVTFKQTDPLFVIDLSVPTNPRVLGELKIPGFSNYLHPYDENTLIGIGKDTGETEWGGVRTKGLKLSLFDVTEVSNPKEIDTYIMGDAGSDSIALNDHKAFLFSRDKNLLVLPVSIRESESEGGYGKLSFSGAAVFTVSGAGFELKGKIDHSDGGRGSNADYWGGYNYYDNTVKRSLYIDEVLYTFSNQYLLMNKLEDLELVKKLPLEKDAEDDFVIIN